MCPDSVDGAPCPDCWNAKLEDTMQGPLGTLILNSIESDFLLRAGVTFTPEDIDIAEGAVIAALHQERAQWEEEEQAQRTQGGSGHGS